MTQYDTKFQVRNAHADIKLIINMIKRHQFIDLSPIDEKLYNVFMQNSKTLYLSIFMNF